jgi:hypothetical protein
MASDVEEVALPAIRQPQLFPSEASLELVAVSTVTVEATVPPALRSPPAAVSPPTAEVPLT